jgi:hypothetical protein
MIGWVIVLAAWMVYAETEMPNRTNECPYVEELCEDEGEGETNE